MGYGGTILIPRSPHGEHKELANIIVSMSPLRYRAANYYIYIKISTVSVSRSRFNVKTTSNVRTEFIPTVNNTLHCKAEYGQLQRNHVEGMV
jgi:hypothetical protein